MKSDIKRIESFYKSYLKNHPEGGGWPTLESALEGYQTASMSGLIPWSDLQSVLDVGAGTGRYLTYLR